MKFRSLIITSRRNQLLYAARGATLLKSNIRKWVLNTLRAWVL